MPRKIPLTKEQKAKINYKKGFKDLFSYCKSSVPWIIVALIFAVAGAVLNLIGPDYIQNIVDKLTFAAQSGINVDIDAIWSIANILIILYLVGALSQLLTGMIMTIFTQRTTKRMRKDISKKLNRLPLKYIDSHSFGDVLSRVTNDVDTIGQTLNNSISTLVTSIALFLGSIIMMFVTNWIMALTAIGASFIGFVFMALIMSKSQKYFVKQQASLGKLNGHIEETYTGHNIVKAYNGEKYAKQIFDTHNKDLYESGWKSQFLSGLMMPLMMFIGNFGYVAVCVVGALLANSGIITFGVVAAFIIYVRLFTQPLSQMAQAVTSLQSTMAASGRVFEILGEKEMQNEDQKNTQIGEIKGNVEFEHIKFGYKALDENNQIDESKLVIKDFSLNVKAGQKVAIVGPTGAGKTTLVNLLMRFYEPNSGKIKVDGMDIADLTREQVHNMFGMVLQDTWLFGGTIEDNIRYNQTNITTEQVIDACKHADVDHFIRTLPKGYDTVIDENTAISAGQKQLFTIARAMVQNSPMLILDEATSSVDTRTEIAIQEAMDKLTKGRTSFVIAHRLSTIKNADVILLIKAGDIVETGTHDELIKKNGEYAQLYNSQFSEE